MATISGPIALYANVPIHAEYYQPSRFVISAISLGSTTTITTSTDHNYVVGQYVRLLIPVLYGAQQLNKISALVISIPSSTQVVLDIDSLSANSFIANPLTAIITGATQANPCVLTANNSFLRGNLVSMANVGGMTQLNGPTFNITAVSPTTITLNINSIDFTAYTSGGTVSLITSDKTSPQIIAIGDGNSGQINSSGSMLVTTYVPGSFINISPL